MDESKPFWQSKSLWGSAVMVLAIVLRVTGVIELDDAAQQDIVNVVLDAVSVVSGAVAAWGRIVAKTKLTVTTPTEG